MSMKLPITIACRWKIYLLEIIIFMIKIYSHLKSHREFFFYHHFFKKDCYNFYKFVTSELSEILNYKEMFKKKLRKNKTYVLN